jgi:ParB family chromosome partitioning protein
MRNSSAFQYLAIDTIHESTTNPRRTFDESKLQELADFVPGHKISKVEGLRPLEAPVSNALG